MCDLWLFNHIKTQVYLQNEYRPRPSTQQELKNKIQIVFDAIPAAKIQKAFSTLQVCNILVFSVISFLMPTFYI